MNDQPQGASSAPQGIRAVARHDVIVSRFLYEDGSIRLKVTGPRIAGATPEDTMEFLVNAVAMVTRVVEKYRDDLDPKEVEETVLECIQQAFENKAYDGFSVVWPRDDTDMGGMGQAAKP